MGNRAFAKRYEFKEAKLPPPIIPLFQYSIIPFWRLDEDYRKACA